MKSFGYSRVAVTVSGQSIVLTRYFAEVTTAVLGVVDAHVPVHDVDPVGEEVGQDAAAEVPEVPPAEEALGVPGLLAARSRARPSSRASAWSTVGPARPMPIRWCQ